MSESAADIAEKLEYLAARLLEAEGPIWHYRKTTLAAAARLRSMEEALRPFAALAEKLDQRVITDEGSSFFWPDDAQVQCGIIELWTDTVEFTRNVDLSDLRRARSLLANPTPDQLKTKADSEDLNTKENDNG